MKSARWEATVTLWIAVVKRERELSQDAPKALQRGLLDSAYHIVASEDGLSSNPCCLE